MSNTRLGIALFLLFPTALLIISVRWVLRERGVHRQLKQAGQSLPAHIVKVGRESFGRSYRPFVTYRFSTTDSTGEPRDFSRTQSISDDHLRRLQGRATVTIRYLPDDPMISRLSDADADPAREKSAEAFALLAVCAWSAALFLFIVAG